jgi:ABC-type phosphate/phosphonate transport system substrate-binding protein
VIAALQMYDWPEVAGRTDSFWREVAASLRVNGVAAPEALSRPRDPVAAWSDPALLLGQSCGLPYVSGACGGAFPVARPVYDVEGCGEGTYRSAIICRAGEEAPLAAFRGCRAAINEYGSQSGCNALADAVRPLGDAFFGRVLLTGAHRASALAVADGWADIAAIDAVAWALFAEIESAAHSRLSVLAWTPETPSLPFITAPSNEALAPILLNALAAAARRGNPVEVPVAVLPASPEDYDPIREMARRVRGLRLAPESPSLPVMARGRPDLKVTGAAQV